MTEKIVITRKDLELQGLAEIVPKYYKKFTSHGFHAIFPFQLSERGLLNHSKCQNLETDLFLI